MAESGGYRIEVTSPAERSLRKLAADEQLLKRIDQAILSLRGNPRPRGCRKLKSAKHDNLYRIRVGDWRILYAIEDEIVLIVVLDVVPRARAYRSDL